MSADIEDVYRLSPLQEGMLFIALRDGDSQLTNQWTCRLRADLDVSAFHGAWQAVFDRNPALRTSFHAGDFERPVQVVHSGVACPLRVHDLSQCGDADGAWTRLLQDDREAPFDLAAAPAARLALARMPDGEHRFALTWHHIMFDGWSLQLLLDEASALYGPPGPGGHAVARLRPFRDYATWLARQDTQAAETFWRERLGDFREPVRLAMQRPVANDRAVGHRPRACEETLSGAAAARLRAAAAGRGLTLSTMTVGAWALALAVFSGRDDVVFGVTVSGRPADLPGIERMVGMFVNTLPSRVRVDWGAPAAAWLRAVQAEQVAMGEFGHSGIVDVQRCSGVEPGVALLDSAVVFENYPMGASDGPLAPEQPTWTQGTTFGLRLMVVPTEELALRLDYDGARVDDGDVRALVAFVKGILEALADDADQSVADVASAAGRHTRPAVAAWASGPRTAGARGRLAHELFERRAAATPDAVAVRQGGRTVAYRELNERANRLARELRARGVGPETVVAIFLDRSIDWVACLLAVLKSGGAYVVLDTAAPGPRNAQLLDDSGAAVVLTCDRHADSLPPGAPGALRVDARQQGLAGADLDRQGAEANLAYLAYTSGSTGRPKGIQATHRGVVNYLDWVCQAYNLGPADVVLQLASPTFDASVRDAVAPLAAGAQVVLAPGRGALEGSAIRQLVAQHGITRILSVVPSVLRAWSDSAGGAADTTSLRTVLSSGEVLNGRDVARVRELFGEQVAVFNLYGPTEATMTSTAQDVADFATDNGPLPVGRPIANADVRVLDDRLQPVPAGAPGEICIGGAGLARGYWHAPGLTAERFVPDPCAAAPGARLYRTGDLGRYRADGLLEMLGRRDAQLKVRGVRVEPAEVEAVLRALPEVADAAIVDTGSPGSARLVAYVLPTHHAPSPSRDAGPGLRDAVAQRLPAEFVPSAVVMLEELPTLASGKVDRVSLAQRPTADHERVRSRSARTPEEHDVADVWKEVLGVAHVGVDDSFFQLGGDSLRAMSLMAKVRRVLGVDLPLSALFERPTVSGLVQSAVEHLAAQTDTAALERALAELGGSAGPDPHDGHGDGVRR